ncbi:MAG: hypothetical protein ACRDN0_36420 [Trebonia sp.]
MTIEVAVPDDWTAGQALAMRQLLQYAVRNAQPVIAFVRKDATARQLHDVYSRIEDVIREYGLEAESGPETGGISLGLGCRSEPARQRHGQEGNPATLSVVSTMKWLVP